MKIGIPHLVAALIGGMIPARAADPASSPVSWFPTGGETVYHLKAARTAADVPRSIVAAAYSGKVLCFDFTGRKLWEQAAGRFFPFDLDVGDIDGDGFDECAVASADGSLYLIDHDGKLLAKVFEGKPPLYSVRIVAWGPRQVGIVCGGPERVLYHISPQGQVVAKAGLPGAIMNLDEGCFSTKGDPGLAVGIDRDYNRLVFGLHRLPGLEPQGEPRVTKESFFYHMIAVDTDGDGRDELVFGGTKGGVIFDAAGGKLGSLQERNTGRGQHVYAMVMLDKVPSEGGRRDELIGLYASALRLYGADGRIRKEVSLAESPAGLCYDAATKTLLLGSGQSGGDGIHLARMDQPGWEEALRALGYQGKLREIVTNIEKLTAQINAFRPPPYQPQKCPEQLCVFNLEPFAVGAISEAAPGRSLVPLLNLHAGEFPYAHLNFAGNQWFSEAMDRSKLPHGWDRKRDKRMKYQLTSQEIVEYARRLEREGLPFVWTIGHGNDPFFLSLSTVEGILQAAPTACKGFIFPEVARDATPAYRYAVEAHVKPVCDLCLKHGNRKVFLRSKFLHWAADCYTDMWDWMLKDRKYKDVIVPAMEETYERLCDLSLSGRLGLQMSGHFSDWAGRSDHDNVCYDRQHQWASGMVGSHFLRALSYRAAMGARYHLVQLSETRVEDGVAAYRDRDHAFVVKPFLHMVGKGILFPPRRPTDNLALSSVALGMRTPSEEFMQASHNSHEITRYQSDPPWVLSRLQCFWGQAPTPDYDFGYYGVGRRRQALNFLPTHPFGLVPIVPADSPPGGIPGIKKLLITDGESWYDDEGARHTARDYAQTVEATLRAAAGTMFVRVTGDVAWTATRIDESHVRLVLIDSGYLDPADRTATVAVNAAVVAATDILSGGRLDHRGNTLSVRVPMGILRVIDIEHR